MAWGFLYQNNQICFICIRLRRSQEAPPGLVGPVSKRQAVPLILRKVDFQVTYWKVRTLQDVVVQTLTMWELRKNNVDIACILEVRIPGSGHSAIKVPGEEACYHLYHSGMIDNTGRHGVAIALSEAA